MKQKPKRIILAGGGTAGHVWPLVTIAEELRHRLPIKFLYLGSASGIERSIAEMFYEYKKIPVGKWRRYFSFQNFIDSINVLRGIMAAKKIIRQFQPHMIVAKGGYVSLPVIIAARMSKVPIVVHESDIVMGATNRFASRFAKRIFTGFPVHYYPTEVQSKITYTGTPVRQEFWFVKKNQSVIKSLKFLDTLPICLVIGGSQGSLEINSVLLQALDDLLERIQVIHLTGNQDYVRCLNKKNTLAKKLFNRYHLVAFTKKDLPRFLGIADVIVSRAGANTLAEIAAAAKPSIIIPLPSAASDHQLQNAKWYHNQKAIILLEEGKFTKQILMKEILKIVSDGAMKAQLSSSIHRLARKDTTKNIAQQIVPFLQD